MNQSLANPIIALWVHPRSMSTAIERIMRERSDLDCLHEPFMYYYYIGLGKKALPLSKLDIGRLENFDDIIADFIRRAQHQPVFFKDMGYYILPEMYNHPELANRFKHLVLIRNPKKSILSYYKLDSTVTTEEIGIESQWNLYQWLSNSADQVPYIIEAERVQSDPISALGEVWNYLNLAFCENAFQWQSGEVPEDWQSVAGWHGSVISSSGIRKSEQSEEEINSEFTAAANQSPRLWQLLEHHQPFYEKLKSALANQ